MKKFILLYFLTIYNNRKAVELLNNFRIIKSFFITYCISREKY